MKKLIIFVFLVCVSQRMAAQAFTDSNLPIVIINTDIDPDTGQPVEIPDDPRVYANMKIIFHPDGSRNYLTDQDTPSLLDYDGRISIEIRGSSSQWLPKKGYGLTTLQADDSANNNVPLLGMPDENDWVLNGLAYDSSLMRDYLSYTLARSIGDYAPRTVYCEVLVNGDYRGLYLLQEKIKIDSGRVNIVKMTASDNTTPNLTGGYIVKADKTTGDDPVAWTMPSYAQPTDYIYDSPKPENITTAQGDYINGRFTSLATAASVGDISFSDGFPSIIDIPTFLDFMIMSEISSNVDSYQLSSYFHQDRLGKLRAGPIWDYNLTYGNDLPGGNRSQYNVWQFDNNDNTGSKFWKDLFDNAVYKCLLSRRWNALTAPGMPLKHSNLVSLIDQASVLISEASVREQQRWGTVPNLTSETNAMKTWLYNRINWITNHIGPFSACANISVPQLIICRIDYHPGTTDAFPVSDDQEFIEIKNAGADAIDLSGIYFSALGITYQFPYNSSLAAGQSLFLASNPTVFQEKYGVTAFGQFTRNLSNNSQDLVLSDAFGDIIDEVQYDDDAPWPDADGNGLYLQLISTDLDNALASSWMASGAMLHVPDLNNVASGVYPNPVSGLLHIFGIPASRVDVYDMRGKRLVTSQASDAVDMQKLPAGVYLVKVFASGKSQTFKVTKP